MEERRDDTGARTAVCNVPWNPTDLCNPVPGVEVVKVAVKDGGSAKGRRTGGGGFHGQGR